MRLKTDGSVESVPQLDDNNGSSTKNNGGGKTLQHKKSGKGPRQHAEDIARKEIPLFMCLEAKLTT